MIAAQIRTILHMTGFKKASNSRSRMGKGYTIRQKMDRVRVDYTPAIDNPARQQDSAEMLSKYRKAIEAAGFKVKIEDTGYVQYLDVSEQQQEQDE